MVVTNVLIAGTNLMRSVEQIFPITGADEKVARVFEISYHATSEQSSFPEDVQGGVQVLGVNMYALGLSQKPIYVNATHEVQDNPENDGLDTLESIPDVIPVALTEPLSRTNLHGIHFGQNHTNSMVMGMNCFLYVVIIRDNLLLHHVKAQSATVAEIWFWQRGSWEVVYHLQSHSLTVTQMEFSHDDNLLLATLRDRQFPFF